MGNRIGRVTTALLGNASQKTAMAKSTRLRAGVGVGAHEIKIEIRSGQFRTLARDLCKRRIHGVR